MIPLGLLYLRKLVAAMVNLPPRNSPDSGGVLNLRAAFAGVGIPVDLLKIIILLPFGVLAVVLARNIVGIQTFAKFWVRHRNLLQRCESPDATRDPGGSPHIKPLRSPSGATLLSSPLRNIFTGFGLPTSGTTPHYRPATRR